MNLLSFLAETDEAHWTLEKARKDLELAKQALETAKQNYETTLSRAEEFGVPRAKLKKLSEERFAAMNDMGLSSLTPVSHKSDPGEKPKKSKAKPSVIETGPENNVEPLSEIEL